MLNLRFAVWMISIPIVMGASLVSGQGYPSKPIRIVTASAGGGADRVARDIAEWISGPLGQPVIVENRGGVTLSIELVSKASPDGYTVLVGGSTTWVLPLLQSKPLWDPVKDFSPITFATIVPSILVVHPPLPVKSVKELIALAKAKPGVLNYSASVLGSASHLAGELFNSLAGTKIVGIYYKGNVPAQTAVIGGEVQMTFGGSSVGPHIKSGKLKALAIGTPQPSALWPELPTVASSGLPGFEAQAATAVPAPAKTPAPIIKRLNQEIVRFLSDIRTRERYFAAGQEAAPTTPQEFAAKIKSEMTIMGKVIKDAGIKVEGLVE